MMLYNNEFLTDILQKDESKYAIINENENILTEQIIFLIKEYDNRKKEIDKIIKELCNQEVKIIYEKIGFMITTQRKIWNILINSKIASKEGVDFSFDQKNINNLILQELKNIEINYNENKEYIDKIENDWKNLKHASLNGVKLSKEIDWENIPEDELSKRLRGGEVLHRDEWIPSKDNSTGRKLNNNELKSHIEFGELIMKEGKEAFENNDFELSYTRYTQGVELLSWVRGIEKEYEEIRLDMYKRFLKNQSLLALKLGKYNDSILSCNKVLQIDECDEKSLYRRGECYMMLGKFEEAKKDFRYICEFDYFSKNAKILSRRKLVEMIKKLKNDQKVNKNIINNINGLMIENRKEEKTLSDNLEQENLDDFSKYNFNFKIKENNDIHVDNMHVNNGINNNNNNNNNNNCHIKKEIKPYFDLETTIDILDDLLFTYTSQDFEKQLYELRRLSDYDEKRLIRRLRKILPDINTPIFKKYGLNFQVLNYDQAKKMVDESISYWRNKNDQVANLSKEIYRYIMGDTLIE